MTDPTDQHARAGSARAVSSQPIQTSMMTAISRDSIGAPVVEDQRGRQVAEVTATPAASEQLPNHDRLSRNSPNPRPLFLSQSVCFHPLGVWWVHKKHGNATHV